MSIRDLSLLPPCDWPEDVDPTPTLVPDDGQIGTFGSSSGFTPAAGGNNQPSSSLPNRRFQPTPAQRLAALLASPRVRLSSVHPDAGGLRAMQEALREVERAVDWLADHLTVEACERDARTDAVVGAWLAYEEVQADLAAWQAEPGEYDGPERDPTPEPAPPYCRAPRDCTQPGCVCAQPYERVQRVLDERDPTPEPAPEREGGWAHEAPLPTDYAFLTDHGGPAPTTLAGLDTLQRRDCERHAGHAAPLVGDDGFASRVAALPRLVATTHLPDGLAVTTVACPRYAETRVARDGVPLAEVREPRADGVEQHDRVVGEARRGGHGGGR